MIIKKKAKSVIISSDNAGQRLDNFLISYIKNVPRKHIYKLIRTGQVRINSSRSKPSSKLNINDKVRIPPISLTESLKPTINKDQIKIMKEKLIYEDKYIIVFNKPSSFSVHSGTNTGYGLIDVIRKFRKDFKRLDLLHRLDKETSGCIIITKSYESLKIFQKKIKNKEINKKYLCLVKGRWNAKIKKSTHRLTRDSKTVDAETHFKVIKYYKNSTLLEAELITGRYHQIRKHCEILNHPIIGDKKYGDRALNKLYKEKGLSRIFLHASLIKFYLNKEIIVECPLPIELESFLTNHN
ncbi:MAG: RluA family pseudouridine synthase [Pseudomonadota bacterium]|jgi:23S rRNA pseudouridine955/2504/2580 synthase|nr:RluA family pseudouridine synthase [Pseudomonadota bacterium]|tara:strand:- start:1932 stop:2822 length:891 start_codon:yes stop_codon:yes gene_type:complete